MSAPLDLPGWTHVYSGKVRDLYRPSTGSGTGSTSSGTGSGSGDSMLVVASDRVSAFDHVLEPGIPGKGELLTTLSLWWFDQLAGADGGRPIPNHLAPGLRPLPEPVEGRAMLVRPLNMLPVECVVRGYLTGSGWSEYQAQGTVCGIRLPAGLADGDRLPAPIFTPAYKAPAGAHDENISFDQTVELVGSERAEQLRDLSLEIYERAARTAEARGLILADTKFEFGIDPSTGSGSGSTSAGNGGQLVLGDEVLTSDSSRYWDAAAWRTGTSPAERMASFDKQIVRNWLAAHWDKTGTPPPLPPEIVAQTAARYRELIDRLTAA